MNWDTFVDVWAFAAGALEGIELPEAKVPDEWRHAAALLLRLPEVGLLERWPGWGAARLEALCGDPRAYPWGLPTDRTEREALFRTIFGARKQVVEDLGLPTDGPEALPRSLTTPAGVEDHPPAATVRRLIAWCRDRDVETEVTDGPFVGQDLTTWDPRALAVADEMLAEAAVTLRLTFRGHRMDILVPPGRESVWDTAQCLSPRSQCEARCPLFGRGVCAKYRVGVGWTFTERVRDHDPRRVHEMPASQRPQLTREWVEAVNASHEARRASTPAETV